MRIRRIFRPSPAARLRVPLALTTGIGLFGLLLSVAVPRDLFGPTQRAPAVSAAASDIRVLDGETLQLGGRVLRLHALSVPERGQATCRDPAGRPTDCGAAAAEALAGLVAGRDLLCRIRGADRHGRALGTCEAGGVEVNASLVATGWALAGPGAAPGLTAIEAAARQHGRGVWAGAQPAPESWRPGS
ncbi:MAG: thermonuclease family protein [Paracraurococcus sp.]